LRSSEEREPFFKIAKASDVRGYRVEQVAHRWVVCAVADEHEMEEASSVVDEVWDDTAPQVELAKVLVRQDEVGRKLGCGRNRTMKVEHTIKLGTECWAWNTAKRVGLNASARRCGGLEQAIKVGGYDGCSAATIRETHQRSVNFSRLGIVPAKAVYDGLSYDTSRREVPFEAAFEHPKDDIMLLAQEALNFGPLARG
jgi:hypothetical protein